ncbi:MAG TPA: BNR-4 repeat-containing protein [Planctomycetota bacterium]|nr:BNR-4 repeat-containing protein [Planctomycetota bacterium]
MVTPQKDDGYRGIWYYNQPSKDEYVYKYSGGLGTYCAKHIPFCVYAPAVNKTFFVYGGTSKGKRNLLEMVSFYDHATGTVPRPRILHDKQTDDAHDNPVLSIDGEGHLWVFCSAHGTSRPSFIYKSVKPYDITAFELVWKTNFSYPQPWWIEGKGFLFLHTLYRGGRMLHWSASPDGRTWSPPQRLAGIAQGHYQVSWPHKGKVGTAFNYHPPKLGLNWRTNLYYVETDDMGKTWKTVEGKAIEPPLTTVGNDALVHDYAADKLLVYMKDINFDAGGNPVILYVTSKGYESGPKNNPRTWTTARWTGKEWDIQGSITSDNNYDTGCLHIESDGTWRIIGPSETGPQPFNPGGEVAMWTSKDRGKSWERVRQMTKDSPYNHTYCRRPLNAHPDFYAFWADGHGRKPSDSRLYFCDKAGNVRRLPPQMKEENEKPMTTE